MPLHIFTFVKNSQANAPGIFSSARRDALPRELQKSFIWRIRMNPLCTEKNPPAGVKKSPGQRNSYPPNRVHG
jgi:hypothetical protein